MDWTKFACYTWKRCGLRYVDENASRYPHFPLEPQILKISYLEAAIAVEVLSADAWWPKKWTVQKLQMM